MPSHRIIEQTKKDKTTPKFRGCFFLVSDAILKLKRHCEEAIPKLKRHARTEAIPKTETYQPDCFALLTFHRRCSQ